MMTSLPSALGKEPAERGDFDSMLLDSFEAALMEKLADGEPGKQERAAKVEAASSKVESSLKAIEMRKEELAAASADKESANTAWKDAITAAKTAALDAKVAAANINESKKALMQL